jgi:hypothetical protein
MGCRRTSPNSGPVNLRCGSGLFATLALPKLLQRQSRLFPPSWRSTSDNALATAATITWIALPKLMASSQQGGNVYAYLFHQC